MSIHKIFLENLKKKKKIILKEAIEVIPEPGEISEIIKVLKEVGKETNPHVFWVDVIEFLEKKENQ